MDPFLRSARILGLAVLMAGAAAAEAGQKKAKPEIPAVLALSDSGAAKKKAMPAEAAPAAKESGNTGATFQELSFNRTLVIEGKVEKPAVQFTLLKEPPPEKEIRFETSFMGNILKLDRENTFSPGETYGRE